MTFQTSEYVQSSVSKAEYNLGVGQPSPQLLPLALFYSANRNDIKDSTFLQYTYKQGYPSFRQALASLLSFETGVQVFENELMTTAGNSSAIHLIGTQIASTYEVPPVAVVESPTYRFATEILKGCGFQLVEVPVDKEGLVVEELERLLIAEKLRPALVFTIPSFHNPTGVTLTQARRQRLIQLANDYHFVIVADEAYQLLNYSGNHCEAAFASEDSTDNGVVFTLGTFSKIFAPGIRLGWIQAHPQLLKGLLEHPLLVSGGGMNSVMAGWIEPLLENGALQSHINQLRQELSSRCECLYRAVQHCLPEVTLSTKPKGGYFLWCKLPDKRDSSALCEIAQRKYQVSFLPGTKCNSSSDYFRLCFAFYTSEELEKAIELLALAYTESTTDLRI